MSNQQRKWTPKSRMQRRWAAQDRAAWNRWHTFKACTDPWWRAQDEAVDHQTAADQQKAIRLLREAFNRDVASIVVRDCCWGGDAAAHAYSLDKAMKMYARVRSLEQVAAMLHA